MVGKLLVRGMLAGIAAGLLSFGFAKIVGEPQVDQAISFEAKANAFSQVLGPAAVVEVSFQVLEVLVFSDGRGDQKRAAGQNFINLGHG